MPTKDISKAVIKRLPRYYRYLGELLESGTERISSGELSSKMHVTASQIRQDLNHFGGFGQQGYGYNVAYLYDEIGKILGVNVKHNMIIVGAGNLGRALANYSNFKKRGFVITAVFDRDPAVVGKEVGGCVVRHIDELEQFVRENPVEIAALTIPKSGSNQVARQLVDLGVQAFWNFSHIDLDLPEHIMVENVHLSESLMRLSYRITNQGKEF
jgi:redox-sensing transcriptional repressor